MQLNDLKLYETEDGTIYLGRKLSDSQRMAFVGLVPVHDEIGQPTGEYKLWVFASPYRKEIVGFVDIQIDEEN